MVPVKICGIRDPAAMTAAVDGGARFVGLVFYPPSPRFVDLDTAAYLASYVPETVTKVGLFVDPSDDMLHDTVSRIPLDMIQLHGSETPERVGEIKSRFGLPVMKAIPVSTAADLAIIPAYLGVSDWLMFDSKGRMLPGGPGKTFDWTLLQGIEIGKPWMLAGGIHIGNAGAALDVLKPHALDISSGVESAPGQKDPLKIRAFLEALKKD